jgi:signal transduction histidine kinase
MRETRFTGVTYERIMGGVSGSVRQAPTRPAGHDGLVAAIVATALAFLVVVGTARQDRASTIERAAPTFVVVLGLVGCLAIVASAWLVRYEHPGAGVGLSLLIAGLLLPTMAGWRSLAVPIRAGALATSSLAVAGVVLVSERWRPGRHGNLVLAVVFSMSGAAIVIHVAGYNPFRDPACIRVCAQQTVVSSTILSTHFSAVTTNLLTAGAAGFALIAMSMPRRPRPPGLVTGGSFVALLVLVVSSAQQAATWSAHRPSALAMLLPTALIASSVGLTVLVVALGGHRTRLAVTRLVARLAVPESAMFGGVVRGIHFAVPGTGRWVDSSGVDVPADLEGEYVIVPDESGPAVRLVVSRGTDAVELMAAFTPAARLALMNARLGAVASARLADVTASRRRVVATADAERRRIERDLHDGAQQRLVSASFHLSVARGRLSQPPPELLSAEASVRDVLAHLRELAHGMFPSVITTEGLRPALEELVRDADVMSTLDMAEDCMVSGDVALAIYATVAATIDEASVSRAASARVEVAREDARVIAHVSTAPLIEADFTDVTDRVGAVGGQLTVSVDDGETLVTAEFPCA